VKPLDGYGLTRIKTKTDKTEIKSRRLAVLRAKTFLLKFRLFYLISCRFYFYGDFINAKKSALLRVLHLNFLNRAEINKLKRCMRKSPF
jgi:hypothetical protein